MPGDGGKCGSVIELVRAARPDAGLLDGDLFAFDRYQIWRRHRETRSFLTLAVPTFAIAGSLDFPLTMAGLTELQCACWGIALCTWG